MTGPANHDYEPPSQKFHRNGSHILTLDLRGPAPLVAVGCMTSFLLDLEIQERTGLRARAPEAILSR